jgi:2'-5' RNA ligase
MAVTDPAWRLFFALDPSPALRERMAAHAARWNWDERARPTAARRLHVTLVFMPRVDPALVGELSHAAARAAASCHGCTLVLDRGEVWPAGGIAHLSPSRIPASLQALRDALLAGALAAGTQADDRAWRPHLTLARKARAEQAPGEFEPLAWQVRGFSLQRSRLGSGRYEVLGRWRLAGAPQPGTTPRPSSSKRDTPPRPPTAASAAR